MPDPCRQQLYGADGHEEAHWSDLNHSDMGFEYAAASDMVADVAWDEFMQWDPHGHAIESDDLGRSSFSNDQTLSDSPTSVPAVSVHTRQHGELTDDGSPTSLGRATDRSPPAIAFSFGQTSLSVSSYQFTHGSLACGHPAPAPVNGPRIRSADIDDYAQRPMSTDAASGSQDQNNTKDDKEIRSPVEFAIAPTPHVSASPDWSSLSNTALSSSNKKRKSSTSDESVDTPSQMQAPKKTSHNMIEKRYRTNLNDKIAALRDSVPSLRVMSRTNGRGHAVDTEDLEGLTPAHKLNKATVLSKATEYIRHLEKRSKRLADERDSYKLRLEAYEKMAMSGTSFAFPRSSTPETLHLNEDALTLDPNMAPQVPNQPRGLIPVPQELLNLHRTGYQQARYEQAQSGTTPATSMRVMNTAVQGRSGFGLGGKVMLGALSGIMILEGLVRKEVNGDSTEARGLFAAPIQLIQADSTRALPGLGSYRIHAIVAMFKPALLIVALAYLLLALLPSRPAKLNEKVSTKTSPPVLSLASPIEVRRKAFLTAAQTIWVPGQNSALECAALVMKAVKLSLQSLIGQDGYSMITGIPREQEEARVKAWEVAIDAQLTGGDELVTWRRLLLTLLASWTLPITPARRMLQALHTRLMLCDAQASGYQKLWLWLFDNYNNGEARNYWLLARQSNSELSTTHSNRLPLHLQTLLALDPEDIFIDEVMQRAYNLAWNKPIVHNARVDEDMDTAVDDFAISSPLDALASWWSSHMLRTVSLHSLELANDAVLEGLNLAVRTAPPDSRSHIKALVVKAIFCAQDRAQHVTNAYEAMSAALHSSRIGASGRPHQILNVVHEVPIASDIRVALTMAKLMALAEMDRSAATYLEARHRAATAVDSFSMTKDLTLLSFVATYRLLECFSSDAELLALASVGIERLANTLRIWVGSEAGKQAGLGGEARAIAILKCLAVSKGLSGVRDANEVRDDESDAGYASADSTKDVRDVNV